MLQGCKESNGWSRGIKSMIVEILNVASKI